jgi:hypothetical protein
VAAAVFPAVLAAQPAPPADPAPDTSTMWRVQVSLLTFGQGTPIFERFGHNAIRILDPLSGLDVSYNWGMFSFEEPNFVGRFVSGQTRYWMDGFPTEPLLAYYRDNNRTADEQVLNLSGAQKAELIRFVRWNALEENKYYRYDYFLDNCSTRVRDVLDRVLGGALKRTWRDSLSDFSFRGEALRLTEASALSRLGIDIALGPPADARMTAWEEMYVPMRMRDRIRGVVLPGSGATPVKLVKSERRLFDATRQPEPPMPASLPGLYVAVALGALAPLALFGGLAFMSALRGRWAGAQRVARIAVATIAAVWYAVCGLLGTLVLFMELFSAHTFWFGNWNVLLLSPVALGAAWFVPRAIVRGHGAKAARWLAGVCAVSALVALALSITGVSHQSNGAVTIAFAPTMIYLGLLVSALTFIARPRS